MAPLTRKMPVTPILTVLNLVTVVEILAHRNDQEFASQNNNDQTMVVHQMPDRMLRVAAAVVVEELRDKTIQLD